MSCRVNIAPADEDLSAPFRVTYRPCGKPVVAEVSYPGNHDAYDACEEHAHEAARDGADVVWPESDEDDSEEDDYVPGEDMDGDAESALESVYGPEDSFLDSYYEEQYELPDDFG